MRPFWVGAGDPAEGLGAVTPPLPVDAAPGHGLLLLAEGTTTVSPAVPAPWVRLGANHTGGETRGEFWACRMQQDQEPPLVPDLGDHTVARIYAIGGIVSAGDFWDAVSTVRIQDTVTTTCIINGLTTTVDDTFLVFLVALANAATTNVWTNSVLANMIERGNVTTLLGNDGAIASGSGEAGAAGAIGQTTVTLGGSARFVTMAVALKGEPVGAPQSADAELASFSFAGVDLSTIFEVQAEPAAMAFEVVDSAISQVQDQTVNAEPAEFSFSAFDSTLDTTASVDAEVAALSFEAIDAAREAAVEMAAGFAAFSFSGVDSEVSSQREVVTDPAELSFGGVDATVGSAPPNQEVSAEPAIFSFDAVDADRSAEITLISETGTFSFVASDSLANAVEEEFAQPAEFSFVGLDATLFVATEVLAEPAEFAFVAADTIAEFPVPERNPVGGRSMRSGGPAVDEQHSGGRSMRSAGPEVLKNSSGGRTMRSG